MQLGNGESHFSYKGTHSIKAFLKSKFLPLFTEPRSFVGKEVLQNLD